MKLKKLLALVLSLCLCASLMAPMASAAAGYTGDPVPIELTANANGLADGTYNVAYTAKLSVSEAEARAFAVLLSGKTAEKMAELVFEGVLVGDQIGSSLTLGENEDLKSRFTMDGPGAANYELTDAVFDNNSVTITYKLSRSAINAWAGKGVETIQDALQGKAVIFTQNGSVNLDKASVEALDDQNGIRAYVEIYFQGSDMTKDRAAFGMTTLNVVEYVAPTTGDDGPSSGGGGTTIEPTPTEPTEPTPSETTPIEFVEDNGDGAGQTTITEEEFKDLTGGATIEKKEDDGATTGDSSTIDAGDTVVVTLAQLANKIVESVIGKVKPVITLLAKATGERIASLKGATTGTSTVDPETGIITTVDPTTGTITTTNPETGETTVEFIMPEGGVQFVVEYETIPYSPAETGVESLLNTDDHIAYTQGDGWGNWRPNDKITRAEIATMIYRLLRNKNVETTVTFSDVPENTWYTDAVKTLATLGILKGAYGKFRPMDTITREEITAICVRFATAEAMGVGVEFADVSSTDWAHDEIAKAASFGWIIGYPDGTFVPDRALTRVEAVTIINRVLGRPGDTAAMRSGRGVTFPDVAQSFWGYTAITESATPHSYTMDADTYTEIWAD